MERPGRSCTRPLLRILLFLVLAINPANGGILGFWRWFQGHYKEAVTKVGPNSYSEFDHVLLDVNQLAHMAARKARDEDHAIRRLLREIARTLQVLRPHKSVVIAFDGPAPLAKIITQRKRRASEKELQTPINSLHLSPGTAFMRSAADAIIEFSRMRLEADRRLKHVRFYVSGSESPGEGEVKLMDWINSFVKSPDESLIIVGGDADLVLQGLALPGLPDFNVFIPDVKRSGSVVSLRHLVGRLEKTFPGKAGGVRNDLVLLLIMSGNDYLPKIRGLTFRAKLEAYERVRRKPQFQDHYMLDQERGTFDWPFLKAFFEDLASRTYVQDIHLVTQTGPTPAGLLHELAQKKLVPLFTIEYDGAGASWTARLVMEDRVYHTPEALASMKVAKHEVCKAVLIDVAPDLYQKYFAQKHGEEEEDGQASGGEMSDFDESDGEEGMYHSSGEAEGEEEEEGEGEKEEEEGVVDWAHEPQHYDEEQYLLGLLWNFQMYNDGYCPDYSFAYRHRFAPSCKHLAAFIQSRLDEDSDFKLQAPVSSVPPFHAALACLAVMPRWGLHLVPNNLSHVLADFPRVDRMYEPGASFSLDLLVDAVTSKRPNMVRSRHFYWSEVGWRYKSRAKLAAEKQPPQRKPSSAAVNSTETPTAAEGASSGSKTVASVSVRRVAATSKPPLRSWEKRVPPLPMIDLSTRHWRHGIGSEGVRWSSPRTKGDNKRRRNNSNMPRALALMGCTRVAPLLARSLAARFF